jgi:hypothetical protein
MPWSYEKFLHVLLTTVLALPGDLLFRVYVSREVKGGKRIKSRLLTQSHATWQPPGGQGGRSAGTW